MASVVAAPSGTLSPLVSNWTVSPVAVVDEVETCPVLETLNASPITRGLAVAGPFAVDGSPVTLCS